METWYVTLLLSQKMRIKDMESSIFLDVAVVPIVIEEKLIWLNRSRMCAFFELEMMPCHHGLPRWNILIPSENCAVIITRLLSRLKKNGTICRDTGTGPAEDRLSQHHNEK